MSLIKVEKVNEAFLRVYSEDSIEMELSEFFCFDVPGAKFSPKYKARMWDGKIRLYNLQTKTLYVGLYQYLVNFAKNNSYTIKNLNEIVPDNNYAKENVEEFINLLKLQSKGNPIEARDYQKEAILNAINKERIVLHSPTASGKSLIIYTLIRWYNAQKKRVIVIVPTTSLVEQMHSDFSDYSTANGWDASSKCQKLYSGFTNTIERQTTCLVTTWQSIYKLPPKWFTQFDVVIGDEAHTFKAASLCSCMEKMKEISIRVGTTGTLDGKQVNKLTLVGLFGEVYKVISTKELIDGGQVSDLKINCILLKYSEARREPLKKAEYATEIDFLVGNDKRNKFIVNLALNSKGNTLILYQFVKKHGKILKDLLDSRVAMGRKVFFVHGGTDTEYREQVRKICEKETNVIILASYGTFSTGINIPSIENVIFSSPTKAKVRILQSVGRGLRLNKGKDACNLYDIGDDLSWKKRRNHTLNHFVDRIKTYSEEKFDYKIVEVNLND